jgi:hypothetical protein
MLAFFYCALQSYSSLFGRQACSLHPLNYLSHAGLGRALAKLARTDRSAQ